LLLTKREKRKKKGGKKKEGMFFSKLKKGNGAAIELQRAAFPLPWHGLKERKGKEETLAM